MDKNKTDSKEMPFEEAMQLLEQIVEGLEEGDVPLEKAIDLYKQGMELSKNCHNKLVSIERQLDQILTEDGELIEADLQKEADE